MRKTLSFQKHSRLKTSRAVVTNHHRIGLTLGVNEVEVLVTVETRRPAQRDEVIQQLVDEGFRVELVR